MDGGDILDAMLGAAAAGVSTSDVGFNNCEPCPLHSVVIAVDI